MGKLLNMTSQNYTKIITGQNQLRFCTFLKICKILNLNPMTLINETNENYILLTEEDIKKLEEAEQVIDKIKTQSVKKIEKIEINNNPNSQIIIGSNNTNNNR
jgi:hypothetical protein